MKQKVKVTLNLEYDANDSTAVLSNEDGTIVRRATMGITQENGIVFIDDAGRALSKMEVSTFFELLTTFVFEPFEAEQAMKGISDQLREININHDTKTDFR